ncbi:MAG: BRO family protein [Salinivirgaceae bacterium]|nr:BRO family protein [Salinivirgaceae bacterium]
MCPIWELSRFDHVHDDEKGVSKVYTPGGPQVMVIISESGLYTLTIRSNKPQARPFRKWVTAEVLPGIRKTG